MIAYRILPVLIIGSLNLSTPVQAQSLTNLYKSALQYDATYLAAKSQFQATLTKEDQAKALTLPSVNLDLGSSAANRNSSTSLGNKSFAAASGAISVTKGLFRPSNDAGYAIGQKQTVLAKAQMAIAEQDLMIRISKAYFDVLASQDSLNLVQTQKKSVAEQLASAQRKFEVGTSTITDTREAQAQFDLTNSDEIASQHDLRVKRLALQQIVGIKNSQPLALEQPINLPAIIPTEEKAWVEKSINSPLVLISKINLEIAKLQTTQVQAGTKPTLDITASYSNGYNNGGSISSNTNSNSSVGSIGLSFKYPLYDGHLVQHKVRETLALEEKARNELEGAQRTVEQNISTSYFGLLSGLSQVKALEAAEVSSQSALEANELGYQVGVRVNIDVLSAQSQLFSTKTKLAKARYNVLINGLQLRQASGILSAQDLQNLSRLLIK